MLKWVHPSLSFGIFVFFMAHDLKYVIVFSPVISTKNVVNIFDIPLSS